MKTLAAVLRERRLPPPYAQSQPLAIEELELDPPGPGEVLVEMGAAGLCHSDLSVINGTRLWPLPIMLGHEACVRKGSAEYSCAHRLWNSHGCASAGSAVTTKSWIASA